MTPERWAQIEELFHRAAECDPKQRAGLLEEACYSDSELRREVEALLASEETASDDMQAAVRCGLEAVTFPLVGEIISHYRILDGLGGGGMGSVYRAEDIKLGRQVALKFLPQESIKNPAALRRFEREARAASALEHPNICPIYEFGEHEGQPFLAMQLLKGQTLREAISTPDRGRVPLPVGKLLDLAIQIASGLEAAHSQGIIHRDIKPANMFVTTQGQAIILDFGLAKLFHREAIEDERQRTPHEFATGKRQTSWKVTGAACDPLVSLTGAAIGTAGYMSPEQVRGERLDARTDLFSFGAVLYEMATGRMAFFGNTAAMVNESITEGTPTPLARVNPDIPPELERIVNKALEKDQKLRYQHASEIRTDLQRLKRDTDSGGEQDREKRYQSAVEMSKDLARVQLQVQPRLSLRKRFAAAALLAVIAAAFWFWQHFAGMTSSRSPKIMLAVLPFENLTGDPNKEYLADGLTEETISQLGRLNPERLGVIARTSVTGYKHKDTRLDQIGRELSVQYVLENSLRENPDHLRLTTQLIQVKDQTHLWSQDYDYLAKDVLNVRDDVAKAVAQEIRLPLTSQQQAELARPHSVNPEAFDAYLQGYYFSQRNIEKDTDTATKYYERATQLDPSYALAWAGLSRARLWQVNNGLIPAGEGRRLAREAVERALALNPNLAEAHAQMGRIKRHVDFDWAGADAYLHRAVELDPENSQYLVSAAYSAALLGRFEEALPLGRRAVDLDPLNAASWEILGEIKFFSGQLDEAAVDGKKARELGSDYWATHTLLSLIYIIQGRPHDALPEIESVRFDPMRVLLYAIAYHALGREKESDTALRELIAKYHESMAYNIAQVYAFRNQSDEAFEWLDRAYSQRDDGLIETKVDLLFKSLHKDPRYTAFLKKLNLPN